MLWKDFFIGIALLLVFEGMLPFVQPERWRKFITAIFSQSDKHLRCAGLLSMLAGISLLYFLRKYYM